MVFDLEAALKSMGDDKSLLWETLGDFIEFYGDSGEKLRSALDENRYDDVEILAHTLKGLGGTFAAPSLRASALTLEKAMRAGEVDDASQKVANLEAAVDAMVADIRVVLNG
jgi:HPt (histidine-containing phosphotransfer) domain-containing protein